MADMPTAMSGEREPMPDRRGALSPWLLLAGVLLVALNLRTAIAAVPPVLGEIRDDLGLTRSAAGLLTAIPVLCFGVLSPAATRLGRRIGTDGAVLLSVLVLAAGTVLRSAFGVAAVFAGTVVIGAALTIGNVLVPGVVKRDFPRSSGVVTGLYTTALLVGAALASGVSAPLAEDRGLGWRGALAVWAVPALVAAVVWAPRLSRHVGDRSDAVGDGGAGAWRAPVAWALAAYMASQSLLYFSVLTWLPALLDEHGVSTTSSGWALSVYNLAGIGFSLTLPPLAARLADQRAVAAVPAVLWVVALVGLAGAPTLYPVWAVIGGLAQGGGISLVLTLIVLRAASPRAARDLSGMVQTVGYLVGATGPLVVGGLRDVSGGWGAPLAFLFVMSVVMLGGALVAGRPEHVG